MRIVFMGTSDFSLKSLEALYDRSKSNDNLFDVVAVYSQPPKPSGRSYKVQKSAVHTFAEGRGIPVFTPKTLRSLDQVKLLESLKVDIAIVSSYGLIIPQNILDIPVNGFINIHASLLPRWRGASPIQSSILSGDKQSGITIMKMDEGIDSGDIISMKSIDISEKISHGELSCKLGDLGAEMIIETLENLKESLLKARKQPSHGVTFSSKITKDSCRIDWKESSEAILRKIMAFSPKPAAWTEIGGIRLKIFDGEVVDYPKNDDFCPGMILSLANRDGMIVSCGSGFLYLSYLQPAGKNKMTGEAFIRGHGSLIGTSFC